MQGFLYSRPVSATDFAGLLRNSTITPAARYEGLSRSA
jgi:hypothetical protein